MLYVRKLFKQDLRNGKQIAFPKEPSLSFFSFDYIKKEEDRKISFIFKAAFNEFEEHDGKVISTRLYAAGSEARMDGEVKAFVRDELNAKINDLLIFKDKGTKHIEYEVMFLPQNNPLYPMFLSLINGDNHSVCIVENEELNVKNDFLSLQQIYYGAPGTGKSHRIKEQLKALNVPEKNIFRTTFHPDSDYSTFVGAYKPTMKSSERIYTPEELTVKLKEIKTTGTTYPCHKFAARYWESIKDLSPDSIKQILNACGFIDNYSVEVGKGVAIGQEYLNKPEDGKIIYNFCPQTFTNAYVEAWKTEEKVFLVIEEINRGNCAQIFGDLFQLLDRENGISEYSVDADVDLQSYLQKALAESKRDDIPGEVKSGKKLMLPSNLYIWATMNTSDQSLFPIDSAFKRRWDWKYVKIKNEHKDWKVDIDIKTKDSAGNETIAKLDWYEFIDKINEIIASMTSSADK